MAAHAAGLRWLVVALTHDGPDRGKMHAMPSARDELALYLRPAGGGLYVVSTGLREQVALQKTLYGASTEAEIAVAFGRALDAIAKARIVLFGVPSDVGAGYRRGANMGPQEIRRALLSLHPDWPTRAEQMGIVDIGDVLVVPQLLHDDMLSEAQKARSRAALFPHVPEPLPVSPLSITERVLELVWQLNPRARPFVLGGDHSVAWPVAAALARHHKESWGIVQPDAHTDLLEERLGIRYCFATWSYHANELLGRGGKLVQVGTRASRFDRNHWESTLGVRQFWADDCNRDPQGTLDRIVSHLEQAGVEAIYFSNDIDGTDASLVDATGTPEPFGLSEAFVLELISRLAEKFTWIGADLMEVAPALGGTGTLDVAARYAYASLRAMAGHSTA